MTTRLPALLAAASATALLLAGCAGDGGDGGAGEDPTPATSGAAGGGSPSGSSASGGASGSADPSAGTSAGGESSSAATAGAPVAVPAYFVGQTPQGSRLYREFRDVPGGDTTATLDAALALIGSDDALDPDYLTLLPASGLRVTSTDDVVTVAVPAAYDARPDGMTTKQAKLAIQQVVFTVQGVLQQRLPVRFASTDGEVLDLFGVPMKGEGYQAADELSVLALVNVSTPAEGATVSGTVTAEGVASSFEGTVPWRVLDSQGQVVREGTAQAEGYLDKLYPWTAQVDLTGLAPGSYQFVAMTDDPSEGESGGPTQDSKDITVS